MTTLRLDHTDSFIVDNLPVWLHAASAEQITTLRRRFDEHRAVEARLQAAFKALKAPQDFACSLLNTAMENTLKVRLDLRNSLWRQRWDNYSLLGGETLVNHFTFEPAMNHLMQNFVSGLNFDHRTGLIKAGPHASLTSEKLLVDTARLAQVCRQVDAGAHYQTHLEQVLDDSVTALLAEEKARRLALAAQLAVVQGRIEAAELAALEPLLGSVSTVNPTLPSVKVKHLYLLGHAVLGALLIELSEHAHASGPSDSAGILLFLPHRPLQRFADLNGVVTHLVTMLATPHEHEALLALIALDSRIGFQAMLKTRLSDAVPDLEVLGRVCGKALFAELAELQVKQIKDDARYLLVPVADVDDKVKWQRLLTLESVGMNLLQAASLFVPGLGQLFLAATVVQVLDEVYEGVVDWSRGHQHEALEHMLGVAELVAVNALGAAGGAAVARGFQRSGFVQELAPVEPQPGTGRLWAHELAPYRARNVPQHAQRGPDGLYRHGGERWWLHQGHLHGVRHDIAAAQWRLQRGDGKSGFAPALQWNGEYGWRLAWQRPQEWQGESSLLGHLWPLASEFDEQRIKSILSIADIDHSTLRRLVAEQRALPAGLRDTLNRFAADGRIDQFFLALHHSPQTAEVDLMRFCSNRLKLEQMTSQARVQAMLDDAAMLREELMAHLTEQAGGRTDTALIQRDFPGLPDVYAADLLDRVSPIQQQRLRSSGRLDLALAERARLALHEAWICRLLQGLYLNNAYQQELPRLIFALLRREPAWPREINFEVRQGAVDGRLITSLYPADTGGKPKVLVWLAGQMHVFEDGTRLLVETEGAGGLLECLWHFLPEADRQRLGWTGQAAIEAMRADLRRRLPNSRTQVLELLNVQPPKPTFRPPVRLPDRRFGYLMSGRGGRGSHVAERTLEDRVRSLYPGFSERQLEIYLQVLDEQPGSSFTALLAQEQSYAQLDRDLQSWAEDEDGVATRRKRRQVADEIRRCWRFQGLAGRAHSNGDPGMVLVLSGLDAAELPDLSGHEGFSHVSEMTLSHMQLGDLPTGFLQSFGSLLTLNLDSNRLTVVPQALSTLPHLRELTLSRNELHIDAAGLALLGQMRQLRMLDLSENPLGMFGLALDQMPRLRQLGLRNVGLTEVPRHLALGVSLDYVDLRDNQITALPLSLRNRAGQWRRRLALVGNPLPEQYRDLWIDPSWTSESEAENEAESDVHDGTRWLERLDDASRVTRAAQWDRLQAEPGSADFFGLIHALADTSDFRLARAHLEARVWAMFDMVERNTAVREQLFALASEPRTCVDSVISTFGLLEVKMLSTAVESGSADEAETQLLDLARRFFRLDQVEAYAREDVRQRRAGGRGVDEVEVSLAYRVGLAQALDLPGQPRTMQFETIAGVSRQDLQAAQAAVLEAEASDALAVDISHRSFWLDRLQRSHEAAFGLIREPFVTRMEAVYARRLSLTDAEYDAQGRAIVAECESAVDAKALELTRQALARQTE